MIKKFTQRKTDLTYPLYFHKAENIDSRCLSRYDKFFDNLIESLGGLDNVIFSPPCTEYNYEQTGRYWRPDLNEQGLLKGFEVALFVIDGSKVSSIHKGSFELY